MTWADLSTEFLLKFGIKINRKLRKPQAKHHTVAEFMTMTQIIKGRNERAFEDRLKRRTKTASYLRTDDRLFQPYVDLIAHTTIGRENFSFAREVGMSILRLTKNFESDYIVSVNKSHLYFGLSLNSVYLNDTINSMIYWELSQQEESHIGGTAFDATTAINNTINKFSSVITPINLSLSENSFYRSLQDTYSFSLNFSDLLRTHDTPELFAYFSSALRFRQVDYWLKNNFTEMTKIYSQELINTLCILCEANLKNLPTVTQTMFGQIINHDLYSINTAVSAIIGKNHPTPSTGLFALYPSKTNLEFNTSFPLLLAEIKTNSLTENEVKAYLIYGAYMLRNKSLHDFNPNLIYYSNKVHFTDAIGLLFGAVSAIKNL